ncbi:MAG: ABC transporter substrate-binding protein [Actinomycetota bacterium]
MGTAEGASALRKFLGATGIAMFSAFTLLLVSCGGGGGSEGGDEPIRVGVVLPYSGVYAQLGEDITDGMNVYFEENKEIAGRPVELVREDEEADPQVGVQAARTLIEREGVDILTGAVATPTAYGIIDLIEREQMPFVISNALGNDATRRGVEYVFRTSGSSWQVTYPMGEYLAEEGVETIFVSAADYAAGQEMSTDFKDGFTSAGGEVVGEAYPPLGTNDYSTYLTEIRQADPEGSWSFFAGTDAVRFVQQYAQSGLKENTTLYGTGNLVDSDTLEAQGEAAIGAQTALFYASTLDTPENREFREKFQQQFDRPASVYAVQGYDAAWLIGEALKATDGNTEDTDALIEAMENVEFQSPRGPMRLDENHNPVQNIYIREARRQGGEIRNVVIDTIEEVQDPGQ